MPISKPLKESTRLGKLQRIAHDALKAGEDEKAWPTIMEMLNIDMDDPQALYMAGVFMRRRGNYGFAAQLFRRVVSLDTREPNPWLHFGCCMHDIHMYDEAIEVFNTLKKMIPDEPGVYANLAASHVQKGDFHEALTHANEALKLNPEHKNAQAVKGMACLGLERWKEGFEQYANMYGSKIKIRTYCQPEEPEWDGVKGLTVVVQCDQGLGDEIRYASVLPDMLKDCKQVILDCHPKLEGVFRRAFPDIAVHGTKKMKEGVSWLGDFKIDARTHISGLGRFYRTKTENFPRKTYLVADPERRASWREKLKDMPRPLVGLAWQGGTVATGRELRSTALKQWEPLIEAGGTFVDLSYHDSAAEVQASGYDIYRPGCDETNYDDTLALIAELDLVVCVPTTVMHAAGALGVPAWVLVPPYTPWEFGYNRKDVIWYQQGLIRQFRSNSHNFNETIDLIAIEYATNYDRVRPETTTGLHGVAELDNQAGEQAGPDYSADIAPTPAPAQRVDRVHF